MRGDDKGFFGQIKKWASPSIVYYNHCAAHRIVSKFTSLKTMKNLSY